MKNVNLFALIFLANLLNACATSYVHVDDTTIVEETRAIDFSEADKKLWISLNRGGHELPNIFDSAKALTINGYRIVFQPGSDEIYILRNNEVLVGVHGDSKLIFDGHREAPGVGTETVLVTKKYLKYAGTDAVFEDYGLDGVDVKFDVKTGDNAESYLGGQKCEKTIIAGLACCRDGNNELKPYRFSPKDGWKVSNNPKLMTSCNSTP